MSENIEIINQDALKSTIKEDIETLLQELEDLLTEYALEAYWRWQEIQNALTGLYNIKRRFLYPPPLIEPTVKMEELY